ncbi:putative glycolipid-binding domain-containing protein [Streptomyces sp. NPDC028635]|uniref:putative glycolipid-binding domain-containing protein n=1 Tax=Streptomyces sp. NPDC028635 TaxID=3154800 RepID=UPI0033D63757
MTTSRVFTWDVPASGGFETAWVDCGQGALHARGRAVGTTPEPYWISYELETAEDFVTRRLRVTAETAARTRTLELRYDGRGGWSADGEPLHALTGALDCDLGLSPLTNTMPVLRHALHRAAGEQEFLMAWVSVPGLVVRPSRQTYTHLARLPEGAGRVRYASGSFRSDLEIDAEGFVVHYPQLATRIAAE